MAFGRRTNKSGSGKGIRGRFRRFVAKKFEDWFPDLANRIHLLSAHLGLSQFNQNYDGSNPYETWQQTTWVYHAVDMWVRTFSMLPMHVVDGEEKVVKLPVVDRLLQFPNPQISHSQLWGRWAYEMATRGEAPFEIEFDGLIPKELWPHFPADLYVRVEKGRGRLFGKVLEYVIERPGIVKYTLPLDDLIHFKFHNPFQIYRGMAPLGALRHATVNDQLAVAWQFYFFRNQARPDYGLVVPSGLTPKERESYENSLTERFGLTRSDFGVGRPIILEDGITDIKVFSFPPKDLEWTQQRGMTADEIGMVFGVPRELMFREAAKFDNYEVAKLNFYAFVILPLAQLRDDYLTQHFRLIGILPEELSIATDKAKVPLLRRLLSPLFAQAKDFFFMGVPFGIINEYFGFGIPRFDSDMISHPLGTSAAFDEQGDVLGAAQLSELEGQGESEEEKAMRLYRFLQERQNGVKSNA